MPLLVRSSDRPPRRSAPSRVDRTLLPMEIRLEALIAPLQTPHPSWKSTTSKLFFGTVPVSICTWHGVVCESDKTPVSMDWSFLQLQGNLSLGYLPLSIHTLYLMGNEHLTGDIPCAQLPPSLRHLEADKCAFVGELDLSCLPQSLVNFSVECNYLSGTVVLSHLPVSLRRLVLRNNEFHGPISLAHLPPHLEVLRLDTNHFNGVVDLTPLFRRGAVRRLIYLHQNNFAGYTPELEELPEGVCWKPQTVSMCT